MNIKELVQVTESCPTQWSFYSEDNKRGFIRYRFSKLTIELDRKCILEAYIGDDEKSMDGTLMPQQVIAALILCGFDISFAKIIPLERQ